ncbi:cobaltochelatase subunit CobN [Methanimicrococcus hacksteinii]|uniref:cobaltochelatase subunit CobN n=1 Tax=Methanimicrococcus hacksteinii TaxID=3028293 RepID=UPI00298F0FC8|nr:cobaltochelatase subunit CobN [Methanimicrococcus sp. At1]
MLTVLFCLPTVLATDDGSSTYVYLLEGDSATLTVPIGKNLMADRPNIIEIKGSSIEGINPGITTVYYDTNDEKVKVCDVVVAGEKFEVLILQNLGADAEKSMLSYSNDTFNFTVRPIAATLGTADRISMEYSAYDFIILNLEDHFIHMGSYVTNSDRNDTILQALRDIHESGVPVLNMGLENDSEVWFLVEEFIDAQKGTDSKNKDLSGIFDLYVSDTYGTLEYVSRIESYSRMSTYFPKASLGKMIHTAESSGYSSDFLNEAKIIYENSESDVQDYTSILHALRKDMTNKASNKGVTGIVLNFDSYKLKIGNGIPLKPTILTDVGVSRSEVPLVWTSDSENVATVDENGFVTGISSGTTTITVSVKGNPSVSSKCIVNVGKYYSIYHYVVYGVKNPNPPNVPDYYSHDLAYLTPLFPNPAYYDFYFDQTRVNSSGILENATMTFSSLKATDFSAVDYPIFETLSRSDLADMMESSNSNSEEFQIYWMDFLQENNIPYKYSFNALWALYSNVSDSDFVYTYFIPSGEFEKESLRTALKTFSNLQESDYTPASWEKYEEQKTKSQDAVDIINNGQIIPSEELAELTFDLKHAYRSLEFADDGTISFSIKDTPSKLALHTYTKMNVSFDEAMNNKKLTWSSSNDSIATVDPNGIVYTKGVGTVIITATSVADPSVSVDWSLAAYSPVSIPYLMPKLILSAEDKGETFGLDYYILLYNSDYTVAWKSSNTGVATVNDGKVTVVGQGKTTITMTVTDDNTGSSSVYTSNVLIKVPVEERIRVLYVGSSVVRGAEIAVDDMYYGGYFDYDAVSGYEFNSAEINKELLKIAGVDDKGTYTDKNNQLKNYDIILFDMFGEYSKIEEALKAAQAGNRKTTLISLEDSIPGPEYFDKSLHEKEDQAKSNLYRAYIQSLTVTETNAALIWGDRFLSEAAGLIDMQSKLPEDLKKDLAGDYNLNVLYIGDQAKNFSQMIGVYDTSLYGGLVNFTILPYDELEDEYEDLFEYSATISDEAQKQIDAINKHLKDHKDDYDLIVLDGFYFETGGTPMAVPTGHSSYLYELPIYTMTEYNKFPTPRPQFGLYMAHTSSTGKITPMIMGWTQKSTTYPNEVINADGSVTPRKVTFEMDEVSLNSSFSFLYNETFHNSSLMQSKRIMSWPYTSAFSGVQNAGFYHVREDGSRLSFGSIDTYMLWYGNNGYRAEWPTVGVWMFGSDIGTGTDDLYKALREHEVNVINGFGTYDNIPECYTYTDPQTGERRQIDTAISIKNFGLNYWDYYEGIRQLEEMDITVLKGIFATVDMKTTGSSDISDKNNMIESGGVSRMTMSSNRDGMFEFIVLGYMNTIGGSIEKSVGYPDQIEWMAERASAWAYLKQETNDQKDIALLYYNYPPGKADIGANYLDIIRSFAGSEDGTDGLLENMRKTGNYTVYNRTKGMDYDLGGYDISYDKLPYATANDSVPGKYDYEYKPDMTSSDSWRSKVLTEENLRHLMWSQGINVGSHAPGVLDGMVQEYLDFLKAGNKPEDWWGCRLMPVDEYKLWLDDGALPDALKEELIETWGTPWEGELPKDQSGMIWTDSKNALGGGKDKKYFVFPCIQAGEVWMMPQPDRALAGTQALEGDLSSVNSVDYHGDMAPTHQYVAFYLWLNRGLDDDDPWNLMNDYWKADAVIHFGTHGTEEWLPGTAIGLQRDRDWGPNLIGHLPNIYPYIVANVGEGLTAEMRGNALIIDHLTPAMVRSGLYGEILALETVIQSYTKHLAQNGGGTDISQAYKEQIIDFVFEIETVYAAMDFKDYRKLVAENTGKSETDLTKEELKEGMKRLDDDVINAFVKNQLHNFLDSIMESAVPLGMHIYGQSPTDERAASMVRSMWGNFRFEEVIKAVYFEGDIIPAEAVIVDGKTYYDGKCDADVDAFVTAYVNGKANPNGKSDHQIIYDALDGTLGGTDDQKKFIELFIRGPIMFYDEGIIACTSDNVLDTNALKKYVAAAWKEEYGKPFGSSLGTDVGIYDISVFYQLGLEKGRLDDPTFERDFNHFVNETIDIMLLSENPTSNYYGLAPSRAVDLALTKHFNVNSYKDQTWINQETIDFVTGSDRDKYADNLLACGRAETQSLLSALSGGYIPPTSGNDPIQNPAVLPTGRNFYGINPDTFPTGAAWDVGKAMGEQILVDYYEKYGEFPSMMSFMRFGVEFIRDEGALEACIYYMLGCEPTWAGDPYTGTPNFRGAKVVTPETSDIFFITLSNGETIQRPRIDITYNTAGMRDGFPMTIRYIDRAVRAVYDHENSALEDKWEKENGKPNNAVRYNTDEIKQALKAADLGLTDAEIAEYAISRTFAQQLGTYEIGTGNMISASGLWGDDPEAQKKMADLYLSKMGYIYNDNTWGGDDSLKMKAAMQETLKQLLSRADASVFASSSNLYDTLDNDDVFQYFGGMNLASKVYNKDGKLPEMYMADTSNVDNFKPGDKVISTMKEALMKDMATRYLNPKWIEAMEASGYAGSTMFAEFVENLFGWAVTTDGALVSDEIWSEVLKTYIESGRLEGKEAFSYSLQSMTGRMMEAVRLDYWDATDAQVKSLVDAYVQSVMDMGVACCHHTCGNPSLNEFIVGQMSVLGYSEEEMVSYLEIVEKATQEEYSIPSSNTTSKSSGSGYGMATAVEAGEPANGEANDEGEEQSDEGSQNPGVGIDGTETGTPTTEVSGFEVTVSNAVSSVRDFIQNPTFSTSSIIAIAIVVLIVGAVFYGFRRKNV